MRILIIDAYRDAGATLGEFLEVKGHEVRVAASPEKAEQIAVDFQPQVVICDPGRRASSVRLLIHAELYICYTGWGIASGPERYLAAGYDQVVFKPDLETLLSAVTESTA